MRWSTVRATLTRTACGTTDSTVRDGADRTTCTAAATAESDSAVRSPHLTLVHQHRLTVALSTPSPSTSRTIPRFYLTGNYRMRLYLVSLANDTVAHFMRPSIARDGEQLDPRCSTQTYHRPNLRTRPSPLDIGPDRGRHISVCSGRSRSLRLM